MHSSHLLLEEPIRMASILEPSKASFFPAMTKIVGTLGPKSRSVDVISGCLKAGMSVARFDFSWGNTEYHQETLENLKAAVKTTKKLCAVMLDTVGPELQVVNKSEKAISLKADGSVVLTPDCGQEATSQVLPINFDGLAKSVKKGDTIFIGQYLFTGSETTSVQSHCISMNTFVSSKIRTLCTYPFAQNGRTLLVRAAAAGNTTKAAVATQMKQNWLDSLTFPPLHVHDSTANQTNADSQWALGIDPDLSGALAVLKSDHNGCSAEVFDTPHLPVLVGKRVRKRLDAKSMILLLRSLDAPIGTTAYVEQSIPYPQDGKQGWWSGGFGYGLWIGILVASGFSVVPIPSLTWKNWYGLSGGTSTKDDSRRVASTLFPSLCSQLKRKKDHGKADAMLIAAYGKGLKLDSSHLSGELVPQRSEVVTTAQFLQKEELT